MADKPTWRLAEDVFKNLRDNYGFDPVPYVGFLSSIVNQTPRVMPMWPGDDQANRGQQYRPEEQGWHLQAGVERLTRLI